MSNVKTVAVMKNVKNPSYDSVLFVFAKYAEEIGRMPETNELADLDYDQVNPVTRKVQKASITKPVVEKHFGSMERLKATARDTYPEMFDNVVESKFFMPKRMKTLTQALGKGAKGKQVKNVIVTSANADAPIFKNGLNGLKTIARFYNAEIIVIPTNGDLEKMPKSLVQDQDVHVLYGDVRLNNAIAVTATKLSPTKQNPVAGVERMVRKNNCSLIFGSPKLSFKSVACASGRDPDQLISTGSISYPRYTTGTDVLSATNQLADYDHMYSAVLIELDGANSFFPRNLSIEPSTGKVRDMGLAFYPDGKVLVEAPVSQAYGDLHSYMKDEVAFKTALGIAKTLKIRDAVMHDLMDSFTTNTHDKGQLGIKTAKLIAGMNNLGDEVDVLVKDLNALTDVHQKVYVAGSNHDDMVDRMGNSGDLMVGDLSNNIYGAAIFPYIVSFHLINTCKIANPLQALAKYMRVSESELLRRYPKIDKGITGIEALVDMNSPKQREKIQFLSLTDSLKYGRTDMSHHGHKGANGAKFSPGTGKTSLGSYVVGHAHSPRIDGSGFTLGCLCLKEQGYNLGGFSSWMHSIAHVYADGSKQMIFILNGRYTNMDFSKLYSKIGKGIKV